MIIFRINLMSQQYEIDSLENQFNVAII